jgi:hypothetical protein
LAGDRRRSTARDAGRALATAPIDLRVASVASVFGREGGVVARRLAQWPFTFCARRSPVSMPGRQITYAPAPGRSGSGRTLTRSGVKVAIAPACSSSVSCPGKAANSNAASPADGSASTSRTRTTEGRVSPDANKISCRPGDRQVILTRRMQPPAGYRQPRQTGSRPESPPASSPHPPGLADAPP